MPRSHPTKSFSVHYSPVITHSSLCSLRSWLLVRCSTWNRNPKICLFQWQTITMEGNFLTHSERSEGGWVGCVERLWLLEFSLDKYWKWFPFHLPKLWSCKRVIYHIGFAILFFATCSFRCYYFFRLRHYECRPKMCRKKLLSCHIRLHHGWAD